MVFISLNFDLRIFPQMHFENISSRDRFPNPINHPTYIYLILYVTTYENLFISGFCDNLWMGQLGIGN